MADVLRDRASEGAAVVFSSHQLDLVEDLCEDVAVIAEGTIVLHGEMDEVRQSAPKRRLEVAFANSAAEWVPPIDHEPARDARGVTGWLVPADSEPRQLLEAAESAGRVTHFTFQPPPLSEIFREAVQ